MAEQGNESGGPAEGSGEPRGRRQRFRRIRALAGRIRPPRTRLGLVVLVVAVGGLGTAAAIGGIKALHWTETAGFCSQCHTMEPQVRAYEASAHRDVACAECHVKPGLGGWIESKVNGAKQTLQMVTDSFPRPIPSPEHTMLPSPNDTCKECHSLEDISKEGGPMKIVVEPRFRKDKSNTRETVAVVVRPSGLGEEGSRGAHWHVTERVDFSTPDEHSGEIDWVRATFEDGRRRQYVARDEVDVSSNAKLDIERLKRNQTVREMNCVDCHNRVGHDLPTAEQAVDEAIAAGEISSSLPYIKRLGVRQLKKRYPSEEEAEQAIAELTEIYATRYPLVAKRRRGALKQAVEELQVVYELIANPELDVTPGTYANNLGHETKSGCFRCHDGAHYRVAKGRVVDQTIPSTCSTCHTFPQVGEEISNISLLGEPADHESDLWVFEHKSEVATSDPRGTSCAACHGVTYCQNCHESGAAQVTHDRMLYEHPSAIEDANLKACSYCHQPASCARCHEEAVLTPGSRDPHRRSTDREKKLE